MADFVVTTDGEIVDKDDLARELRVRKAEEEIFGTPRRRVVNSPKPGTNPRRGEPVFWEDHHEGTFEVDADYEQPEDGDEGWIDPTEPVVPKPYNPNAIIGREAPPGETKHAPGWTSFRYVPKEGN